MKNTLIALVGSLALLVAGASLAAKHEAPAGDAKPAQKEAAKPKKPKCPEGQMYNKKEKKCVAKEAATPATPASPAKK